jgi:D-alanyl-D-alanine carboxypeptidase (penicillin-binding protein 5/6)
VRTRLVLKTFFSTVLAALVSSAFVLGASMPIASAATPAGATKKDEPQISAPHAILIEGVSGSVLFERAADDLVFPASLAKLMTAEVVFNELKQGRIKLTDEYVTSENAWRRGGAPSGGSTMFAALHSRVPVADLLRGVIIQSANDACIILAEGLAGNELAFAEMMTKRAREIGLMRSVFTNSNGLPDPDTKVTARELALLARHIIKTYPEYYPIYAEREFTWNKIRQQNRNPLLAMSIGADGLKTGYTKEAGYNLVGSAVINGMRLIAVVTGLQSAKERADEGRKLLEWGFRNFETRMLFAEGQTIGSAKVFGGAESSVALVSPELVQVMVPKAGNEKLIARIVYTGPVKAPIRKGQPIGTLKIWRDANLALEVPLQAGESVERGTMSQRAFDAASELVIGLLRAGVQRL